MPVSFALFIDQPFDIEPRELSLLPKRTEVIQISFNPNIYDAKISTKVKESLYIRYNGHPKNQKLDVFAEFCYPNIRLEKTEIDFGTVLNDTT